MNQCAKKFFVIFLFVVGHRYGQYVYGLEKDDIMSFVKFYNVQN